MIPVEPRDAVLVDHALVVHDGEIVEVAPSVEASARYQASRTSDLPEHALVPGLVNTHTHAAMTLLRGAADDLPLMEWLTEHIWPIEGRLASTEYVRAGTDLAIAEMLLGGTTCFNDMYFFPDVAAEAAERGGIRACLGLIVLDTPTAWARDAAEYIAKGLELHDAVRHSGRITTAFAPHAPYTVSDGPLEKIRVLADELDIPIHIHVHETAAEVEESVARYGVRPLERLARLHLLDPRVIAIHMTQLLPGEIDAVARSGTQVVHCPESNLKLASGMCPVSHLKRAGVNVALGTDGAASNNDLDMFGEMRTAALLAKGVSGDPTALPAHEALEMATLNGARALGLDASIGSLVPGKAADVAAVDLRTSATQPVYDPVSQIVYSASRDQVTDVWVDGQQLVRDGKLERADEHHLIEESRRWAARVREAH